MLPGLEILPNFVPGLHHDVLHLWHRLGEAREALQMVFLRLLGSSSGGLGSPYAN